MIYIITTETFPKGLAATQRLKCYAKSVVELGYACKVLCVNRSEDPNKPRGNVNTKGVIDGYEYLYMGRTTLLKKPWQNTINQLLDTLKLVIMMLFNFRNKDKVILYLYNPLLFKLIVACSRIRRFEVFFELNEHPVILKRLFGIKGEAVEDLALIRKRLNGVDGVLCISTALQDLLVRSGLPQERVHIVNMQVDTSRFDAVSKEETESYVGYCGAADNNKDGVDQLINAFNSISDKYPELKLYIMGPRRTDCQNEQLVKNLGLEGRIIFTGVISPTDLPQKLINARILALDRPQSIQAKYGFPTKLGEYLSTGNPVIVTSVGDIPLFLKDCESAYLVEPDNVEAFAAKMDHILSHNDESKRVGLNGREVAMKHFSGQCIKSQLKVAMKL